MPHPADEYTPLPKRKKSWDEIDDEPEDEAQGGWNR